MNLDISTDKEVLTVKNDVQKLNRVASTTFNTDRIDVFNRYMAAWYKTLEDGVCSIYYDKSVIKAWATGPGFHVGGGMVPVSICSMKLSDELVMLSNSSNVDLAEDKMLSLLETLEPYGQGAFQKLKNSIENMEMKKIVSMAKSKDSRGNFSYEYSVKDEGRASFSPPEEITFNIPVFKHVTKLIQFKFRFKFSYRIVGEDDRRKACLTYHIDMLNFSQFVEKACTTIVEDGLKDLKIDKYWGSLEKKIETDEWKYKQFPMQFKGVV